MPVESPSTSHDREIGFERLVFFSDAVFAIAITLLVLDIRLPSSIEGLSDQALLAGLLAIWPRYLAYFISFLVIGEFWIGHHRRFNSIQRCDQRLILLNLLMLMSVAFIPFPTGVIAENGNRTATIFYALSITLMGLLTTAGWVYAIRAGLVDPQIPARSLQMETLRTLLVPAVFLVSISLAWISPDLPKYAWLLILPLAFLLRNTEKKLPA
jgi:uncharacterized membrane protein